MLADNFDLNAVTLQTSERQCGVQSGLLEQKLREMAEGVRV